MEKCSVRSTRKRNAGSNVDAARAAAAPDTMNTVASSARVAAVGLPARTPPTTRDTGEDDAEDERGDAEQAGADEEQPVRLDQRASDRQPLDPDARESLRELADVCVRRAQQSVLRRGVAEAREARHVGHERDAGEADPEVVRGDHRAE